MTRFTIDAMKADKPLALYRQLRSQPLWRLLAADTGPTVLALLQTHLYDAECSLPASILHERIDRKSTRLNSSH